MRKTLIVLILAVSIPTIANDIPDAKKFEVTFTVTYNAITLAEAAEKEQEFRTRFKDACKVDLALRQVQDVSVTYGGGWIWQDTITIFTPLDNWGTAITDLAIDSLWVVD